MIAIGGEHVAVDDVGHRHHRARLGELGVGDDPAGDQQERRGQDHHPVPELPGARPLGAGAASPACRPRRDPTGAAAAAALRARRFGFGGFIGLTGFGALATFGYVGLGAPEPAPLGDGRARRRAPRRCVAAA